jgi:uncharacterized membrane protein YdjX (TVP38/TMEM64 family)
MKHFKRLRTALTAALVLALPLVVFRIPAVARALLALVALMRTQGALGVLLFACVYAIAAMFAAPILLFHALAGYVYGPVKGVLVASPSCVLAASVAFLLGRSVLRAAVRKRLADNKRWAAIEALMLADGLKVCTLLRLTPMIPQNFFPFAAGSTAMRYRDFALATWLGLLPIQCVQAIVGSQLGNITAFVRGEQPASSGGVWGAVAVVLVSVVMIALVVRTARKRLAKMMDTDTDAVVPTTRAVAP